MKKDCEYFKDLVKVRNEETLKSLPPTIWDMLDGDEQLFESNETLRSAACEYFASAIENAPHKMRQEIERISLFLRKAKANGKAYCEGNGIVHDFNLKFNPKTEEEAPKEDKPEAPSPAMNSIAQDAKKIMRQMLFRSFFWMQPQERRAKLISFIKERDLCDPELELELKARIDEKRKTEPGDMEALFSQVKSGGLDCFAWLHQTLFDFFTEAMMADAELSDLKRKLDNAAKLKVETPANTPPRQVQESRTTICMEELESLRREKTRLELEVGGLRKELDMNKEAAQIRLEAELGKASAEKRLSEASAAKQGEEFARRSKLAAHVFETFLKTLPPVHAAVGYGMLQSIINEWDSDLDFIQERARRFTMPKETPQPPIPPPAEPKSESEPKRSGLALTVCMSLAILLLAAASLALWLNPRHEANMPQTSSGNHTGDISRLVGVRLDMQDDLCRAYDVLKPLATPEEMQFLNTRSQIIMRSKNGELPR